MLIHDYHVIPRPILLMKPRTSSSGDHDYVIRGGHQMLRGGCACLPELQTQVGVTLQSSNHEILSSSHDTDISPVSCEPT